MEELEDQPGPSTIKRSPSEERENKPRLFTEDDVNEFLGGVWPSVDQDSELSDNSEDEGMAFKKRKVQTKTSDEANSWGDEQLSNIVPTHFLECPSGPARNLRTEKPPGPVEFFETVLPSPILDLIIASTNQTGELASQKRKPMQFAFWKPLTEMEFKIFLGLLYHMEEIALPKLKDYWRRSRLYSLPIFQNMMPRNRFLSIMSALSFNNIDTSSEYEEVDDKFYRVRPLMDHFNNILIGFPSPDLLSIEQSITSFKGNTLFQKYNWHKRLGIFILHMLLKLAWLVYCEQMEQKIPFQKFRVKIVETLLPEYLTEDISTLPLTEKPHYMSYIGINPQGKKRRKRCKYCMEMKNKRKESYFCCIGCNNHPGFCIDGCFAKYHGYM